MPQYLRPSTVVVTNPQGEGHLRITLELNINVNSQGQATASITTVPDRKVEEFEKEDEFSGFEIPSFGQTEKLDFGTKVL